jgi:carbonic anhydrase
MLPKSHPELLPVHGENDILPEHLDTPVADLLRFHNLVAPLRSAGRPRLAIATCIDPRIVLRLPRGFAFVLRTPSIEVDTMDFALAYAAGVAAVSAICVLGHDECGLVDLGEQRDAFVTGLALKAGWTPEAAGECFDRSKDRFVVGDSIENVRTKTAWLRERFPRMRVAPLFYGVREGRLLQVRE